MEVPAPQRFSFLRADGAKVVNEMNERVVLKGCNLGNWLLLEMWMLDLKNLGKNADIPDQQTFFEVLRERFGKERGATLIDLYRQNWIRERDFEILRSFGFNVVRLPFHYSVLEDDAVPFQLRPDAFRWLDQAVEWAKKYGMYVILDLHGAPGGQSVDHTTGQEGQNRLWTDEECQARTVWLWREIAKHYRDEPAIAAYELLNEPFGDYRTEAHRSALLALVDRLYRAIRDVDSRHIIVMPGTREGIAFYGAPASRGWENVMFTEHHYPGVMYGSPSLEVHIEHVNTTLYWLRSYLENVGAPFLLGEFNVVFRRAGGPELMRYYFDLCERNGWWATTWSYKLLHKRGGVGRDNWYLVTYSDPAPCLDLRSASYEEIAAFFQWLGTAPYAIDEELRQALSRPEPSRLVLEDRPRWLKCHRVKPLPGWHAADIASMPEGGQEYSDDARITIWGGGRDIWDDYDEFRFVWQEVEGDFDFQAAVVEFEEANRYSKAGLMIRKDISPSSAHLLLHVFPDGQVVVGWRERSGAVMQERKFPIALYPIRLRLERRGHEVVAHFRGAEDEEWREIGRWECRWLDGSALVGLAVLSHDRRFLAKAVFDDLSLSPRAGEEP